MLPHFSQKVLWTHHLPAALPPVRPCVRFFSEGRGKTRKDFKEGF